LMDTNTHTKLFTVLAINTDPAPSVHTLAIYYLLLADDLHLLKCH